MPKDTQSTDSSAPKPAPEQQKLILAVVALMVIEALAISAVLLQLIAALAEGGFESLESILFEGLLAVLAIIWIVASVSGLLKHSPWSRSSSLVIQLMVVAFGFSLLTSGASGGLLAIGIAAVVIGALAMVILFSKPVDRLLSHRR